MAELTNVAFFKAKPDISLRWCLTFVSPMLRSEGFSSARRYLHSC
ncbi:MULTISPECIES: hypothetical protein [Ensifer]|uniref:Transposase n=1 Tax=Ensifer adhaerens TaxID=106592 RepID=A0ABY8HSJ3_ENSAD|nr:MULTISPECIES: hypothetical protein [Ensifer]WFP95073.1 hypothetical protein P4B07_28825 [Ensifer adhaerens]